MKLTKDLVSGALLLLFGGGAALIGSSYAMGTVARMGPGYFPTAIGILIAGLGLVVAARAILSPESSEPVELPPLRPVLFVSAAVLVFGLILPKVGLFPSIVALVLMGRLSDREGNWAEALLIAGVLCVVCYVVFIRLLQLRIPLVAW